MASFPLVSATGMLGSGFRADSLDKAIALGARMIGCDAGSTDPIGLQYITVLARSVVIEIEAMVTSARPASSGGMRPVEGTCTHSSSTPMSFAIWRATATSEPSGCPSLSRMPKGGLPTSMVRHSPGSSYTWSHVLSQNTKSAPIREMSIDSVNFGPTKFEHV